MQVKGRALIEAPVDVVANPVDTTAAGDSFAAGYLTQRLAGASAETAAAFGNRLATIVVQHPGAIVAREAMAELLPATFVHAPR